MEKVSVGISRRPYDYGQWPDDSLRVKTLNGQPTESLELESSLRMFGKRTPKRHLSPNDDFIAIYHIMRLKNITHHLQQIQVYIHPRDLDVKKRMKGALEKHNFENRFTVSAILGYLYIR